MSSATARSTERITSPLVMGAVAAITALGVALAVCVVPALAAQVASSRSSLGVLGAVLLGIDAFVLGHGGSLTLGDGAVQGGVRLVPLGLTAVLLVLAARSMHRMGRALALVTDAGALRTHAVRDAGTLLGAYVAVYALGGAALAALARTPRVHAVSSSAMLGCGLVALVGGAIGMGKVMRGAPRDAEGARRPLLHLLELLPDPYGIAVRGAVISLLGLFTAGMLALVGALALGIGRAGALWDQLAPGVVGGVALLLLHVVLLPTFALWALSALLGGRFAVGIGTSVSLGASRTGVLPALPLLGVLPEPGRGPWYAWLLLVLPIAALTLGAVRVVRDVRGADGRTRAIAYGVYAGTVVLGTLLLLGLATGGIGSGRLRTLGPLLNATILPLLGLTALTLGGAVLAIDAPLRGPAHRDAEPREDPAGVTSPDES